MIAYLIANNLPDTAAALRKEVNFGEDVFGATTAKKYEGMLEKKWTSIVRLQKKVDLHSRPLGSALAYSAPLSQTVPRPRSN